MRYAYVHNFTQSWIHRLLIQYLNNISFEKLNIKNILRTFNYL